MNDENHTLAASETPALVAPPEMRPDARSDGEFLLALGKRVRARYRTFKLRDLGYSQFKSYVADLEGIAVERRSDGAWLGNAGLVHRAALPHADVGYALLERHAGPLPGP